MIEFLLVSAIATSAPRTSPPVRSTPSVNPAPVSPTSKPASAPPAVPVVYPSRTPSPDQPNKSWFDKTWERYQDRQRNLPNN